MHHIDTLTKSSIKIDKIDLHIFYWLPKLRKILINHASYQIQVSTFFFSTAIIFKHITSALTTVKDHVIKNGSHDTGKIYCDILRYFFFIVL